MLPTISKLKKTADDLYSKKLREQAADSGGYVKCYTCATIKHWKELQCGHYVTRTITNLRFNPLNTHPQCVGCNLFNQGRLDEYALHLIKDYGPDILQQLNDLKRIKMTNKEVRAHLMSVIENCSA